MTRLSVPATVALTVVLVVSLGAGTTVFAQEVPDARLTVTDATVTPEQPVTGAPTTVSATVSLSAGSPSPVSLDRVELREGDETLAAADDLGALSQGGTLTVPLTTTFDSPGARDLELRVVGENATGAEVSATRPLSLVVESAPPQVTVRSGSAVADSPHEVAV
ncbi:hypothetical protein ACFSBT_00470, partial [Halomarina rubra]